MKLITREMKKSETAEMLMVRNATFGNIGREQWDAMGCTAVIAKKGREMLGAIPLQHRDMMVNGRVSVPVVFENAVGVAKKARGTGIGTHMINTAADFITGRAVALCVLRGGERSDGYRFYRKTGHADVYYSHLYVAEKPAGKNNDIEVRHWKDTPDFEPELFPLYRQDFGAFGSTWKREPGYFGRIIRSHVSQNESIRLYLSRERGGINGYAIVNGRHWRDNRFCIFELCGSTPAVRNALLDKILFFAAEQGAPVDISLNSEHPYYGLFLSRGFAMTRIVQAVMVRVLDARRIFRRLAAASFVLHSVELLAETPHRDVVINRPACPRHRVTLYLKESYLSRLMFCRLNLACALATGMVRATPMDRAVAGELHRIFAFSPWIYTDIDFV